MSELSGAAWVAQFPTSRSLDDLSPGFKASVNDFIGAVKAAGGNVNIAATYRPPERAYLMHYAWDVSHGTVSPSSVPAMAGVDIQWDHGDDAASRQAAQAMVDGYQIVYRPSLTSNHSGRNAIDMRISGMSGKTIVDKAGDEVEIRKLSDLNDVGASYGVIKLVSDPPHWSADGH